MTDGKDCKENTCYQHLKEYIDLRCVGVEELLDEKIRGIDRATALAAQTMDKRLDSMNEFRDALKDQSGKMLTRDEYLLMHEKIKEDVRFLREDRAKLEGKADQAALSKVNSIALIGLLVGVMGIVIAIVALILGH